MVFLLERSGDNRQAFGPYSSAEVAKHKAGKRYMVVRGDLANGQTLTRSAIATRVSTGSLEILDDTDPSSI